MWARPSDGMHPRRWKSGRGQVTVLVIGAGYSQQWLLNVGAAHGLGFSMWAGPIDSMPPRRRQSGRGQVTVLVIGVGYSNVLQLCRHSTIRSCPSRVRVHAYVEHSWTTHCTQPNQCWFLIGLCTQMATSTFSPLRRCSQLRIGVAFVLYFALVFTMNPYWSARCPWCTMEPLQTMPSFAAKLYTWCTLYTCCDCCQSCCVCVRFSCNIESHKNVFYTLRQCCDHAPYWHSPVTILQPTVYPAERRLKGHGGVNQVLDNLWLAGGDWHCIGL
jgi:hypothetical protein